jgi:DNA-binding NarL/FixJ family response regulator
MVESGVWAMPSKKKLTVFVADDSALIRERLPGMLAEITGVEVIGQAADGIEAVNSIGRLKPDVVVLDIRMPGKNGIEVLQELKKFEPALCVIMLTNYPYPQYRKKCLDKGADYFLDKSADFDGLLTLIKQLSHKGGQQSSWDQIIKKTGEEDFNGST